MTRCSLPPWATCRGKPSSLNTSRNSPIEDSALPIEAGQTISQPYIVARMLELAEIKPGDKVLEIGAGSGYAAAVMSRMASKVFAIERHEELAKLARARLKRLGYANAEIIVADGTKGLPEEAPFQAIIVSAGGPHVPEALKQQLALGGRLIIPIGQFGYQTLIRVRRTGKDSFEEEEDFGAVAFVPLIGEEGWAEPKRAEEAPLDAEPSGFAAGLLLPEKRARTIQNRLSRLMAEAAEPFGDLHELCELVERFADCRVILLGEATHGTAEFYQARARITEMLVDRHGFNIVAVEADWPDAAVYDAYVRDLPRPKVPKTAFTRFPTWMWRNGQVAEFLDRLKEINATIADPDRKAGFYGLDIYSLGASIEAVLRLSRQGRSGSRARRAGALWLPCALARRARALRPHGAEPRLCRLREASRRHAGRSLAQAARLSCQGRRGILRRRAERPHRGRRRAILPRHLLRRRCIMEFARPAYVRHAGASARRSRAEAKAWSGRTTPISAMRPSPRWARCAASTISGSSRASAFGDEAALIGFGTDRGTVAAASDWDGLMEIKRVRPARDDSYEGRSRDTGIAAFLLETGSGQRASVRSQLAEPLLERAIGVIYRPETEFLSHYFQAELSRQFDAWIWFEETEAVAARPVHAHGPDETYPFGL